MYYIGVHSTSNINDGYMGSGSLLKRAIKEFGIHNFDREILHVFNSRKEALNKEEELVSFDTLKDLMCYNLIIGGNNGIKSIKEKRAFFSKKANDTKTKMFIRFNKDVYFKFSVVKPFKFRYNKFTFLDDVLSPEHIMSVLNNLYNNAFTHKHAIKFLDILKTKVGYKDNITVKGIKWEDQQYTQKN